MISTMSCPPDSERAREEHPSWRSNENADEGGQKFPCFQSLKVEQASAGSRNATAQTAVPPDLRLQIFLPCLRADCVDVGEGVGGVGNSRGCCSHAGRAVNRRSRIRMLVSMDSPPRASDASAVPAAAKTLAELAGGDASAASRLLPIVYDELRALAAEWLKRNRRDHTLQPTALVHEAYLRLVDQTNPHWQNRAHFYAVAVKAMRQILIDHARRHDAAKRGGNWRRLSLDEAIDAMPMTDVDVLALDEALTRLAALNQRQADIVELRFIAGLSVEEAARVLNVSPRTVKFDWRMARAWLSRELTKGDAP
jgi:RNA polymerase sigma-70 factor (ECF subfamily)